MKTTKQPNKLRRFWRGVKRACLAAVCGVCIVVLWWAYTTVSPLASTRGGRAALWTAGHTVAPMLDATPWYVYGVLCLVGCYLWWKHKVIGSIVAALVMGVVLAV